MTKMNVLMTSRRSFIASAIALIPTVALGKMPKPKATVKIWVCKLRPIWEPKEAYEWTTTSKPYVELAKEAVAKYPDALEIRIFYPDSIYFFDKKFIGGYFIWHFYYWDGNNWSPEKYCNYDDPHYEMFEEFHASTS